MSLLSRAGGLGSFFSVMLVFFSFFFACLVFICTLFVFRPPQVSENRRMVWAACDGIDNWGRRRHILSIHHNNVFCLILLNAIGFMTVTIYSWAMTPGSRTS